MDVISRGTYFEVIFGTYSNMRHCTGDIINGEECLELVKKNFDGKFCMKNIIIILLCYLLGCFNTGYYYIRFAYKTDIRDIGTTAAGARNAGRVGGVKGFIITLLGVFLIYDYKIVITVLLTTGIFLPFLKDSSISVLAALILLPIEMFFILGYKWNVIKVIVIIVAIILYAFRSKIKEFKKKVMEKRKI